jgi:hypothetical protein
VRPASAASDGHRRNPGTVEPSTGTISADDARMASLDYRPQLNRVLGLF